MNKIDLNLFNKFGTRGVLLLILLFRQKKRYDYGYVKRMMFSSDQKEFVNV